MLRLFVWRVGSQDFAMPFTGVMQVVRAVAVSKTPVSPPFGCGEINVRGNTVPVIDMRKRFCLPQRALDPADHFIIVGTPQRALALWVDVAHGVVEYEEEPAIPAPSQSSGQSSNAYLVPLSGGVLLMPDLERCLSAEQDQLLDGISLEAGR